MPYPFRVSHANVADLPKDVTRRLAEKREDGNVIGICGGCSEETYANADGLLRVRMMSGSPKCIGGGPHRISRFYIGGPLFWTNKAERKGWPIPEWAAYWIREVRDK